MASAFLRRDRDQWMADFRGYGMPPGKRQVLRVPPRWLRDSATVERDARAFAEECERYARRCEGIHDPEDVQHAQRLGVLTDDQAAALLSGRYVPPRHGQSQRLTIRDAALGHPSTARDSLAAQVRYLKHLDQFTAHAGVAALADLQLAHVLSWIEDLTRQGYAWDTRRHALLYLRRACTMAPRHGLPDVMAGVVLNQRDRARTPIRTWTLPQLLTEIEHSDDPRTRAALALGGLLGLRPSEIVRATVADLRGDQLAIGQREAKNDASVRTLIVPACVLPYLTAAIGRRQSGPLIQSDIRRKGRPLTTNGLHQVLSPTLTKPKAAPIAVKDLRKTFATWAAGVIAADDLERYLGHRSSAHAIVTSRHYLAAYELDRLRAPAKALEAAIRAALPTRKPPRRKSRK